MPVQLNCELATKRSGRAFQSGCVLDMKTLYFPADVSHQTGQDFPWTNFYEGINTFPNQQLHRLQPAYRRRNLPDERLTRLHTLANNGRVNVGDQRNV